MTTPSCVSAITLKYLSQHITYKLALSLTRQLKLTLSFSVFLRKQIVNTSTKPRPFVTQKNFVHLLLCLHYYPASQPTRVLMLLCLSIILSTSNSFTCLLSHLLTFNYHNLVMEILIVHNLHTRERVGFDWLFVVGREVVDTCCSL